MADYVDGLSDAELRTKLAEFGFPVVPITATTRKVMSKKLKLLIENKNKLNSNDRRSLAKYSSGEESDNDILETTRQKDKNRRITLGGAMLPPSSSKLRRNIRKPDTPEKEPANVSISSPPKPKPVPEMKHVTTTTTTKRVTRTVRPADEIDFEDGSDSDIEVIEEESPKASSSRIARNDVEPDVSRTSYYSGYGGLKSPIGSSTGVSTSGLRSSGLRPSASTTSTSGYSSNYLSSRVTSPTVSNAATSSSGSKALDDLNIIRARLSLNSPSSYGGSSSLSSTYARRPTTVSAAEEKIETPYLSEFSRRLAQVTGANKRDDFEYKRDIIKENEAVNGSTFSRAFQSRFGSDRDTGLSHEFKHSQEKNIFKNNVVSFTLIGIACAFFVAISFLYVGMRNDQGALLEPSGDVTYCTKSLLMKPGTNCIEKDSVDSAMQLLNGLMPELIRRAVNSRCGGTSKIPAYVTDYEVLEFVTRNSQDEFKNKENLYNLQVLVLHNTEKWGIDLIETKPAHRSDFEDLRAIKTSDDLAATRTAQRVGLLYRNVDVPFSCLVYNKLYSVFVSVLVVVAGFALVYFGQRAFKYYLQRRAEHERSVYAMVEKIVDVLSLNCTTEGGENYLAVNHVRDILIPIHDRKNMASVWNSAVYFIENNESRVRPEIQIVAGEQYRVWRWLDNSSINLSVNLNRSKIWQGQAFETQEGSVNSLPVSPTQCLKIRHMFEINESSPNWTTVIKDTILEKCGDNCRIYHIGIDKSTCCVYLKCATQKDAGIAYKNLHGWWYDGHLITVKYLRLERYMERFPDSPSSGAFLKPSNDRRLNSRNEWSKEN